MGQPDVHAAQSFALTRSSVSMGSLCPGSFVGSVLFPASQDRNHDEGIAIAMQYGNYP